MKSDRELTILAAKAAGFEFAVTQPFIGLQLSNGNTWNPLTDDGDALRLAAKLEMDICFHSEGAEPLNVEPFIYTDAADGDKMQATRRAIVLAAAAIAEGQA